MGLRVPSIDKLIEIAKDPTILNYERWIIEKAYITVDITCDNYYLVTYDRFVDLARKICYSILDYFDRQSYVDRKKLIQFLEIIKMVLEDKYLKDYEVPAPFLRPVFIHNGNEKSPPFAICVIRECVPEIADLVNWWLEFKLLWNYRMKPDDNTGLYIWYLYAKYPEESYKPFKIDL